MPPRGNQAPPPGLGKAQAQQLKHLIGRRVLAEPLDKETDASRLLALAEHARRKKQAEVNPYRSSFIRFVKELVYTSDEAAGGKVAKAPDWPMLNEMADAMMECELLFVEKSRRVFASWMTCAYDVWVASGGQDPRWPITLNATGNRQVYIVSQKFEQSCFFLERRVRFIVEQLEARKIRDYWPDFPAWTWKEGQATLSNHSYVNAVAQGSDQLRGPGSTAVHIEEGAFLSELEETLTGLLTTIRGGGRVVLLTTPAAGTFAKKIRDGHIASGGWV